MLNINLKTITTNHQPNPVLVSPVYHFLNGRIVFGPLNRHVPAAPPGIAATSPASSSSIIGLVARNIYKKQCFYHKHAIITAVLLHIVLSSSVPFSAHLVPALAPGVQETMSWHTGGKGAALGVFFSFPRKAAQTEQSSRNGSGAIFSYLFIDMMPCLGFLAVNYFDALGCHCV